MNIFCRKGDLIRLLTPTVSAWQGIGIAAETVYDDGNPDTVVPFYKQDQPLEDQAPSIALIGEVEVVSSTTRDLIQRLADELEYATDHYYQQALKAEARAYLAQPEPEGPTVMEIIALADEIEEEGLGQVDLVRRALARWGHQPPAPVPVSERPWEREGWCDAEGRCWWGRPSEELCNSDWFLATRAEVEEFCEDYLPLVSLPHWALPVPQ